MSPGNRRGPAPDGDQPSSEDQAAAKLLDTSSLPPAASEDVTAICQAHIVLLLSRSGKWLRKPYLLLHSAQAALQRAEERGQPSRLVLCKLVPLSADLELGPEMPS